MTITIIIKYINKFFILQRTIIIFKKFVINTSFLLHLIRIKKFTRIKENLKRKLNKKLILFFSYLNNAVLLYIFLFNDKIENGL